MAKINVLTVHLLYEVQPAVVDVVLGEGGHWFRSLPQRQVAIVGLTYHQVVQLLWGGVMILNLDTEIFFFYETTPLLRNNWVIGNNVFLSSIGSLRIVEVQLVPKPHLLF